MNMPVATRYVLVAIVLVIVLAGAAWFFYSGTVGPVNREAPDGKFTLMPAEGPWQAPSGEVMNGIFSYDAQTGEAVHLLPLSLERALALSVTGSSVSGDGTKALVQRDLEDGRRELSMHTFRSDVTDELVAAPEMAGAFHNPILSAAGQAASFLYVPFPNPEETGSRPESEPHVVTLATGERWNLERVVPVGIGPNDAEALVVRPEVQGDGTYAFSLVIVDALGNETELGDIASLERWNEDLFVSPGARLLVVRTEGEGAVYAVDWDNRSVAQVGTVAFGENDQVVFGTAGGMLLVSGDRATAYAVEEGELRRTGGYAWPFDPSIRILHWNNSAS